MGHVENKFEWVHIMGKRAKSAPVAKPKPRRNRFDTKKKKGSTSATKCKGGCDKIGPDKPTEIFPPDKPVCPKRLYYQMVMFDSEFGRLMSEISAVKSEMNARIDHMVVTFTSAFGMLRMDMDKISADGVAAVAAQNRMQSKNIFYSKRHHRMLYDCSKRIRSLEDLSEIRTQLDSQDQFLLDRMRGDVDRLVAQAGMDTEATH